MSLPQGNVRVLLQQPTVTFNSATGPTSLGATQGAATQLFWSGNNNCTWSSNDTSFNAASATAASGNIAVSPEATGLLTTNPITYTLQCPQPTTPAVATLTLTAPPPPKIWVNPTSITLGSSATLNWTINNGDVCTGSSSGTDNYPADAFTSMQGGTSGSIPLTPNATGTDTYSLNCTVQWSPPVQPAVLTVNPSPAKIAIKVTPLYDLDIGDPGILSWTLNGGASGCVVSGSWPNHSVPQFSSFPVASTSSRQVTWNAAGTYTYTLTCSNPAAPAVTSVTITNEH